jgi:hypothetical protein
MSHDRGMSVTVAALLELQVFYVLDDFYAPGNSKAIDVKVLDTPAERPRISWRLRRGSSSPDQLRPGRAAADAKRRPRPVCFMR